MGQFQSNSVSPLPAEIAQKIRTADAVGLHPPLKLRLTENQGGEPAFISCCPIPLFPLRASSHRRLCLFSDARSLLFCPRTPLATSKRLPFFLSPKYYSASCTSC